VGVSFKYGPRGSVHGSTTDYVVTHWNPYSSYDYTSYKNSTRGGNRYSVLADYSHTFKDKTLKEADAKSKGAGQGPGGGGPGGSGGMSTSTSGKKSSGHKLKTEISYSNWNMDEESTSYLVDAFGDTTEGQKSTEIGPSHSIRGKIEYTLPLTSSSTFETGTDAKFNWKSDANDVYYYDPLSGDFVLQNQFYNNVAYKQNTFSGYAMYSAEFGLFGIQGMF
jgi:hypothetical protein